MNRPYIICHMLTTLDGKIAGPAFACPETGALAKHYQALHRAYQADATLYGKTTLEEVFTKGRHPELDPFRGVRLPREDYIAAENAGPYLVSVDPDGGLGWTGPTVQGRGPGYDGAHVIEVLQEDVPDEYLAYLREQGISYLFGGARSLCFAAVCSKLYRHFGIAKMLLQGGGLLNGSFAAEDLIDELSLCLAPAANCGGGAPALFETAALSIPAVPRRFVLNDVQRLEHSGLVLQYIRSREEAET